jgi:hypothetical protein
MKIIEKTELRSLVQDRLNNTNITNVAVCLSQKGIISVFKDMVERVHQGDDLYVLIPDKSSKNAEGKWMHDLINFKLYKFDKSSLTRYLGDKELEDKVHLNLSTAHLIYDSTKGEIAKKDVELTTYEKVCLELRLPESGLDWLDNLIIQHNIINYK